jgi:hypothetical protein
VLLHGRRSALSYSTLPSAVRALGGGGVDGVNSQDRKGTPVPWGATGEVYAFDPCLPPGHGHTLRRHHTVARHYSIVDSSTQVQAMRDVLTTMARLSWKFINHQAIGRPCEEGYIEAGVKPDCGLASCLFALPLVFCPWYKTPKTGPL